MALVQVHNISDRNSTKSLPKAFRVGGIKIRPGSAELVDDTNINSKVRRLHGTHLWIGALPPALLKTAKSLVREKEAALSLKTDPMTIQEAREYLGSLTAKDIRVLADGMVPPLTFKREPPVRQLVARVSRAMFSGTRILDPSVFFWSRRWTKSGSEYVEK